MSVIREQVGVWIKDRWRYELALRRNNKSYLGLCNRSEKLQPAPDNLGYACLWKYTSRLHAASIHLNLGHRLLRRCLHDSPMSLVNASPSCRLNPLVSVMIGHRGLQRLPLLLKTLENIATQKQISFECIVIEHDSRQRIVSKLPGWVRYVFAPTKYDEPYNRSHTFNVGAAHAKGRILLLHDNDMLVPEYYLQHIANKVNDGYQAVNPKRFVFYLSKSHTQQILQGKASLDLYAPEYIVQNLEAGGSMAITRQAFWTIGGMDEGFRGWGGEDNEFWERCLTMNTWVWGYEPIIHLWHESQPLKYKEHNPNIERHKNLSSSSPQERIAVLRSRPNPYISHDTSNQT